MKTRRPYTYLATVQGMCRQCRELVPCRIIEDHGAVFQERMCPKCGPARARIADSVQWYRRVIRYPVTCKPSGLPGGPVQRGCPHDCGPCAFHANACRLPVFSITNACNMACPICFTYNRADQRYHMSRGELAKLLDHVVRRAAPLDLINITGGEPTLHPQLLDLLDECRRPQIGRVTMNTNGLRMADDATLCADLAERGVYVVLSFDTFDPEVSRRVHGRDVVGLKLRALANLQRFGIGTTLLNVMIRGVNDGEIGRVIDLARQFPVVRSITVQTMTFTGAGGGEFGPREHTPLDGAMAAIQKATAGAMRQEHFFPHPGAHPLCYSIAYYLKGGEPWRSFTDFLSVDDLRAMLADGYLLHPGESAQATFKAALDRLWADGGEEPLLRRFKNLIARLYPTDRALSPAERQRRAEEDVLTIYLHSHMDEDTLDLGRLVACPDQVPDPDGRMIPACAYNLFYRRLDPRFYCPDAPPVNEPAAQEQTAQEPA